MVGNISGAHLINVSIMMVLAGELSMKELPICVTQLQEQLLHWNYLNVYNFFYVDIMGFKDKFASGLASLKEKKDNMLNKGW